MCFKFGYTSPIVEDMALAPMGAAVQNDLIVHFGKDLNACYK